MSTVNDFIVDKCFGPQKGYNLVRHLIDSFNDFMLCKLDDIIQGFNDVVVNHTFIPEDNVFKYNMSIKLKNPVITKPMIVEKDGSSKIMTPKDARNRNFTYASPIFVDMYISTSVYNQETKTFVEESKKITNVCLGKIPIMVRSKYCVLNDMPALAKDECPFDYGGYFIANGNEKVIVCQDRIGENKVYVFVNNKVSTFSHIAEIRSVQENKFSVPKTTTLKLSNKPNQFGRFIRLNIHHVKQDIPLVVLFRALGVESDLEIAKQVMFDVNDPSNATILAELAGSFEEGNHITCQRDAMEYLAKYMNINGYPKDLYQNKSKRLEIVRDVLTNELLPHVGPDFYKKSLYLGYMVNKLLKCFLGIIPFDDRDSYINKRIDIPGILMANLFRQYYGRLIKDMKNMINKEINNGSWKATNNFLNVINNVNIGKILKSTIVDAGLKYGLATGNWGIRTGNKTTKQGVAQVLNRMAYMATLSHLRRMTTPVEKTGKLIQPRKLHSTQWGIICPAETPEGVSVGLVKNMSMVASITISSNSTHIRMMLPDLGTIMYNGFNIDIFCIDGATKVIVNGDMVGVHMQPNEFFKQMKGYKRNGTINVYTGIYWNILRSEIWVCTEGGRCVRPTLIVEDNKVLLTQEMIDKYGKTLEWTDLVIGNDNIPSVVEYLDVEETNFAVIAMNQSDIDKQMSMSLGHTYPVNYTHMELDPSLMLGVLAGSIPFSDHNQAPRNCYQAAMGKQAIGIYTSNFPKRYDTMGHILNYGQKPLVQTKVAKIVNNDILPCGANVIVAIMCATGYNQEDSLMMNESSVNRGLFTSTYYRTDKVQSNKNHSTGEEEYFCKPNPATTKQLKPFNYDKLGPDGFVPVNTYVESGDVIIGKCMPQKNGFDKDNSHVLKNNEHGFIDCNACNDTNITNTTNSEGYHFAKVRVRSERIPSIGDKFCLPRETEVLTLNGWKLICDLVKGEEVVQLNPETGAAEIAPVQNVYRFSHTGTMYNIEGQHIHVCATAEHKMWVKDKENNSPNFKLAKDLSGSEIFYKGCSMLVMPPVSQSPIYNINLYNQAYLYGSFMAFGFVDMFPKQIFINSTTKVKEIIGSMDLIFTEKNNSVIRICMVENSNKVMANPLFEFLKDIQSKVGIEHWIYDNKMCAMNFIEGLFANNTTISCTEDRASQFQIIALAAGYSADVTRDHRTHDVTLVRNTEVTDYVVSQKHFEGSVYCIEVPSHIFYIRSNGKTCWTGNSSRHGQKGTVGMMYRQEDMPFTKDGLVPDIIINPHAIPSRMTIAQLMECIMGKACSALGTTGDASPFTGMTVEDIAEALRTCGIEQYGNEIMYNSRTGEQIQTVVFIGPTYYQRLKHMVNDKIHSRSSSGPVVLLTRQPAEGRARDGGLRVGEMEVECLWAHGIPAKLKECFMECSDNYRVHVCKKCGMMANVNPEKNIYNCKPCKNTTQFSELRIPYACKLLMQEIQSMSIGTRFIT